MKRSAKFMLVLSILCLSILFTQVSIAGPEGGLIVAPKTGESIKIDGKLDDWNLELFTPEQKIVLTIDNGFINNGSEKKFRI